MKFRTVLSAMLLISTLFGTTISTAQIKYDKKKKNPMKQEEKNYKSNALQYKVFTVKRPGVNRDPNMPAGNEDLRWVVNTATLVYGKKDAVLIDTYLTIEQSKALADSIEATGKNLTTIYITHPHGDHFFSIQILLDRFPNAKAVSTKSVVDDCAELVKPEVVKNFWKARFPGQIPDVLTIPEIMNGNSINLEGNKLLVEEMGFTDTHNSTSIYVPSIGLVVAGDVVYNDIHPYQAEVTSQTRKEWIAALDKLESLHPKFVVAGHKKPENPDSPVNILATKKYLEDFERLNTETSNAVELYNKMLALYPNRANPGSLWGAATSAKK